MRFDSSGMLRAARRLRAEAGSTHAAELGLKDQEAVLRGGFLSKPRIVKVIREAGSAFMPLWKGCPVLNQFLLNSSVSTRYLRGTDIVEKIASVVAKEVDERTKAFSNGDDSEEEHAVAA